VGVFDRACSSFRKISYLVVESDSSDWTVEILERLKRRQKNFHFVSLGGYTARVPAHRFVISGPNYIVRELSKARNELTEIISQHLSPNRQPTLKHV
jgi:hypothetical protein